MRHRRRSPGREGRRRSPTSSRRSLRPRRMRRLTRRGSREGPHPRQQRDNAELLLIADAKASSASRERRSVIFLPGDRPAPPRTSPRQDVQAAQCESRAEFGSTRLTEWAVVGERVGKCRRIDNDQAAPGVEEGGQLNWPSRSVKRSSRAMFRRAARLALHQRQQERLHRLSGRAPAPPVCPAPRQERPGSARGTHACSTCTIESLTRNPLQSYRGRRPGVPGSPV